MVDIYNRVYRGQNLILWLVVALVSIMVSSCGNSKKIVYFRDIPQAQTVSHAEFEDTRIRVGDILSITVQTIDPKSTEIFAGSNTSSSGNNNAAAGYIVDRDGYIEMPLVGKLKVEDLTIKQARELVKDAARKYYVDPVVNIRITNFQVTVLGEVSHPGNITLTNEKTSVLDAIGFAGDLTVYGRRENVLLIREENGKKAFVRLDLNSTKLFQSPYYYVRTGDVIYVEPNTVRARASTIDYSRDRYLSYTATLVSLFALIYSIVRNNN